MNEAWEALGLDEGCALDEVKRAWRYLSKKYHPDSSGGAGFRFARIAEAYRTLTGGGAVLGGAQVRAAPARPRADAEAGLEAGLEALGKVLLTAADSAERRRAARALGFSGRRASWLYLRKALYDPDPSVALAAVRACAHLSVAQASGEVAALYARSDAPARRALLRIAELTGERLFLPALASAQASGDPLTVARAWRLARAIAAEASGAV